MDKITYIRDYDILTAARQSNILAVIGGSRSAQSRNDSF